jgi:hypothetical protein
MTGQPHRGKSASGKLQTSVTLATDSGRITAYPEAISFHCGRAFPNCPIPNRVGILLNALLVGAADNPQNKLKKKFAFAVQCRGTSTCE